MRLVAVLAAVALVPAAQAGSGTSRAALAIVSRDAIASQLVRVDPATLRILGPRVELGRHGQPWTRSPDGSRLAVASGRVPGRCGASPSTDRPSRSRGPRRAGSSSCAAASGR